tara:strand:+ start:229 stop:345 length:117 start_codon:yes stop_codon:yes gene_type:complete
MARFCHFWRLSPEEYRRLKWEEYQSMIDHMNEVNAANK